MLAELDPGFTLHGFLANVVLTAFGAAGGFAAAWWIYRKTSQDDRERFQQQLEQERQQAEQERQQFQDTIAHDIRMRREEDENRRRERDALEQAEQRQLWIAVLAEINGNEAAINFMRANPFDRIPLRRAVLDQSMGRISKLPTPVGQAIQLVSLHIDQTNSVADGTPRYGDSLTVTMGMLESAEIWLGRYLTGQIQVTEQ